MTIGTRAHADWKVGQEVVFTYGRAEEAIRTIEKIDRGRAFVAGMRFRSDGSEIRDRGDRSWVTARIRPATAEDKARIAETARRADAVRALYDIEWGKKPTDVLDRVLEIVRGVK